MGSSSGFCLLYYNCSHTPCIAVEFLITHPCLFSLLMEQKYISAHIITEATTFCTKNYFLLAFIDLENIVKTKDAMVIYSLYNPKIQI